MDKTWRLGLNRRQITKCGADMSKTNSGNFFEDFELGQKIIHATPRTVTTGA